MIHEATGLSEETVKKLIEDHIFEKSNPVERALFYNSYAPTIDDLIKYDNQGLFQYLYAFFHFDERRSDDVDLIMDSNGNDNADSDIGEIDVNHFDTPVSELIMTDKNGIEFRISFDNISGIALEYIDSCLSNIRQWIKHDSREKKPMIYRKRR